MTSRTGATFTSPIVQARHWLAATNLPAGKPLINLSQAAPMAAPPEALRREMARLLEEPTTHLYGPVLGNPDLRQALAQKICVQYGAASVTDAHIAITPGCNQAFAATIAALCDQGDEVILPVPWYFNHKMWLDMSGCKAVPLPVGPDMLPDPEQAAALITAKTKAIVLVTPNNPTGTIYPAPLIRAFMTLAQERGITLIVDETYRDFLERDASPHDLFDDPDWDQTLVRLYSFSKAYLLTGHRVGAIAAHPDLLHQIEKFLDTTIICAPQLGQRAANWSLTHLDDWLEGERQTILATRQALLDGASPLTEQGWRIRSSGAYFAWLEHPFHETSFDLCQRILREEGVLMLPDTMFRPESDPAKGREIRIAIANIAQERLPELFQRLAATRALT